MKLRHTWFGMTLVFAFLLSACAKAGEFKIMDAWARPPNAGENGAAYFVIQNGTAANDIADDLNELFKQSQQK